MTDATRYLSISEADFAPYFVLTPNGDPCTIDNYSIYFAPVFVMIAGVSVPISLPLET